MVLWKSSKDRSHQGVPLIAIFSGSWQVRLKTSRRTNAFATSGSVYGFLATQTRQPQHDVIDLRGLASLIRPIYCVTRRWYSERTKRWLEKCVNAEPIRGVH
jgi:hypothetical protein